MNLPLPLEALHPALWRAHQLGSAHGAVSPSGFPELDLQLPGGGWPHRALTELLLPHPGLGEMRLLAPMLAAWAGRGAGVMLFDPPTAPCAWALAQLGLDARQWLLVNSRNRTRGQALPQGRADSQVRRLLPSADLLWALEQALKSGHAGAVLAWLPARLGADALRRLQLAAQAHDAPVFLLREPAAAQQPSVAVLRLVLQPDGQDRLRLRLLKRRGPPMSESLRLWLPPVLGGQGTEPGPGPGAPPPDQAAGASVAPAVPPRVWS